MTRVVSVPWLRRDSVEQSLECGKPERKQSLQMEKSAVRWASEGLSFPSKIILFLLRLCLEIWMNTGRFVNRSWRLSKTQDTRKQMPHEHWSILKFLGYWFCLSRGLAVSVGCCGGSQEAVTVESGLAGPFLSFRRRRSALWFKLTVYFHHIVLKSYLPDQQ